MSMWQKLVLLAAAIGLTSGPTFAAEDHSSKLILVVGATGQQGGAVARELLSRGYQVRGLTRNPESERAQAVADLGATMVQGDLGDRASLDRAVAGAYGVYAMTDFWEHGYKGEVQHGKNIADAAGAAGVQHIVYSSVASADKNTGIPHFESKYRVEIYLHELELPVTIVRPVSFMENWFYVRDALLQGVLEDPRKPDSKDTYVAVGDIGRFVAEAFDNPKDWIGVTRAVAGDQMTLTEAAEVFEHVLDRPVKYRQVTWEDYEAAAGAEMTAMLRWFEEAGYETDLAALREEFPWLLTLEEYLRQTGW